MMICTKCRKLFLTSQAQFCSEDGSLCLDTADKRAENLVKQVKEDFLRQSNKALFGQTEELNIE